MVKSAIGFKSDILEQTGNTPMKLDDYFKKILQSQGIYKKTDNDYFYKFNRFNTLDPYSVVTGTREYIFFTKPDLNIFAKDDDSKLNPSLDTPLFRDGIAAYKESLKQLQYSCTPGRYPFMNLLSNARRSNLELPAISTERDIETAANMYGTFMTYRGSSYLSDENFDFSIEFEDTKNLDVYMLFKYFDEYDKKKRYGAIEPPSWYDYVGTKVLHDQFSIFKFIVTEDASTILYYAKYYGCYPKSVPRETFSDLDSTGQIRFSVNFHCSFVEDMEPNIIDDFNAICNAIPGSKKEIPIYDKSIFGVSGEWCNAPYIEIIPKEKDSEGRMRYKLKWR